MKKLIYLFLVVFANLFHTYLCGNSIITNDVWGGRFGDQLVLYITTKWLAYKYNLPLYYRPFKYSDNLALHYHEKKFNARIMKEFKNVITLRTEDVIEKPQIDHILYKCNFYCHLKSRLFDEIVQNKYFASKIKELTQPVYSIPELDLPPDKITVAIHVRKGGGFDRPLSSAQIFKKHADRGKPLKFPPEQYYIDQLKILYKLLDESPLYIFIFTDDANPKQIIENFKKQCNYHNITFSCRVSGNSHNKFVVEDFWNMRKFDCLICAQSSYALAAQFTGYHKIIIEPMSCHWEENRLIIDDINAVLPNYTEGMVQYYSFNLLNQELKLNLKKAFVKEQK